MEGHVNGNLFDMEAMDGMLKIHLVIGDNQSPSSKTYEDPIIFCSSNNFKETYTRWLKSAA